MLNSNYLTEIMATQGREKMLDDMINRTKKEMLLDDHHDSGI